MLARYFLIVRRSATGRARSPNDSMTQCTSVRLKVEQSQLVAGLLGFVLVLGCLQGL